MNLRHCRRCDGLNPETVRQCVHCGASSRNGRALFLAASATASTLIACACYGLPVCEEQRFPDTLISNCVPRSEFIGEEFPPEDAGADAGSDGGELDAGVDGGDVDAGIDGGTDGGP